MIQILLSLLASFVHHIWMFTLDRPDCSLIFKIVCIILFFPFIFMVDLCKFTKEKYDRQIRLFGREVQSKLNSLSVSIISSLDSFVSGEILKNIVLLGVNKIYADEKTLNSFKKLVPNSIKDINPRVNILDKPEGFHFIIGDTEIKDVEAFFINNEEYSEEKLIGDQKSSQVKECLLGAIIVQEFIKKLQNQTYQKNFSLKSFLN